MAEAPLVTFLIAGVQKGGTTALYDYLADYPDVALSRVKEVHFFDDETRDWARPDYDDYHAGFDAPGGRPCGEATPIYLYWPQALERICAYNPAMRLVVALRDPVERAWSHWKMEYARGKETEPFAWCIREGRARMAEGTPYPGFHRVCSYVERGFYGRQLARLLALFPRHQLLLLASDTLKRDPTATIGTICAFLNVAPPPGPIAPRISRPAADLAYPTTLSDSDVIFLQRQFADELARFRLLGGESALGVPA